MNALTVEELIQELEKIEDKNKPIISSIDFFKSEIKYVVETDQEVQLTNWEEDN